MNTNQIPPKRKWNEETNKWEPYAKAPLPHSGGEEKSGEYVEMENGLCHFVESSSPNKRGTVYYMGRIKSLENEILSLKQQLKEKQGWSDAEKLTFSHIISKLEGIGEIDLAKWLTEYKSKTNR